MEVQYVSCPKCKSNMDSLSLGEIQVERCQTCFGIWLDAGEAKRIINDNTLIAKLIDTKRPAANVDYNKLRSIRCPRCVLPLKDFSKKIDLEIFHYEGCEECHGLFLDAGELSRLDNKNAK